MIRFSAILVAGAIAVLIAGVLATSLALVYASIVVSVLAALLLAVGVLRRRGEIFGEGGASPASYEPAWSATPGAGAPVTIGGGAKVPGFDGRPAESGAGFTNGSPGTNGSPETNAGRDADAGTDGAGPYQADAPGGSPLRAPRGEDVPGNGDPAKAGPTRIGRIGGYSGTHSSGRGRPMTGPPGRREPSAPPAGTAPRGAGGPGANGAVPPRQGAVPPRPGAGAPWYEDTPPRPRQAPAWPGEVPPPPEAAQPGPAGPQPAGSQPADPQSADPAQGPRPDQWVPGSAPPAYGAGAAGPPGRAATGAGPVGWLGAARPPDAAKRPDADSTQEEPPSVRWPSRQADPGRAPGPPGWLPDWPSSPPAQDSLEAAHDRPEAAHDRPEATQDQPAATHDRPASENDDFWDRVNEELGGDAGLEQRTPPGAPPVGGDRWSTPSGRQADEAAEAGSGAGSSTARDLWSPWPPRAVSRPGPPLAEGEDRPRDRADAAAQVAEDAATRTAEPAPARRDAAADRPGAAGAGQGSRHRGTGARGRGARGRGGGSLPLEYSADPRRGPQGLRRGRRRPAREPGLPHRR